jgi:hypothetical protein
MSSNLGDLSHVLSIIDPLRSVMADTMAGREPPTIIVLGAESSGKSTILERMIMLPIFPRQQGLCTRIAIKVHLRRVVDVPMSIRLDVCEYQGEEGTAAAVVRTQNITQEELCGNMVRDEMTRLVREENELAEDEMERGMVTKTFICLNITGIGRWGD